MSPKRSATLLVLLPVLALALWWMASGQGSNDGLPGVEGPVGGADETVAAAPVAVADATDDPDADQAGTEASTQLERVEVPVVAAFSGTVVDDAGVPIEGALVSCRARVDYSRIVGATVRGSSPGEALRRLQTEPRDEPETVTADDGHFRLRSPVGGGELRLSVLARGYLQLTRNVPQPNESEVKLGAIEVQRGAILGGRVVDANGLPVAGAHVRAVGANEPSWMSSLSFRGAVRSGRAENADETDSDGQFELAHAKPGAFTLRVSHSKHPPESLEGRRVQLGASIDDLLVVMRRGSAIEGRIVGSPADELLRVLARRAESGNSPFAVLGDHGGEVFGSLGMGFGDRSVDVAADGSFVLDGLDPALSYHVWAMHRGATFRSNSCTVRKLVPAGTRGLQLPYDPGIGVAFHVVDAETGEPLTHLSVDTRLVGGSGIGAFFSAGRVGRSSFVDYPDGWVTVGDLRPKSKQKLTLRLEALGYAPFKREDIELPMRGELNLGVLRLKPAPLVHVSVIDGTSGAPIEGARVALEVVEARPEGRRGSVSFSTAIAIDGGSESSHGGPHMAFVTGNDRRRRGVTDADGLCTLNSFPGETARVEVSSEGYARYAAGDLSLPQRGNTRHQAAMVVGATVAVLVVDVNNEPVGGATVMHRSGSGRPAREKTDATGHVSFEFLVPGAHRFKLARNSAAGGRAVFVDSRVSVSGSEPVEPGWEEITVRDGEAAELTLMQPVTGELTGVVRENGLPLARARIRFVPGTGRSETAAHAMVAEVTGGLAEMISGRGSSVRTDGVGRYHLKELSAGEHRLRITHADRVMSSIVSVMIVGGEQAHDVDLTTAVLTGRVIAPDGIALKRASVSVSPATAREVRAISAGLHGAFGVMHGGDDSVTTDSDGRYELRGVRPNVDLVIRAKANDCAPVTSDPVQVREGQTVSVADLTLVVGGRVDVTVTGAEAPFSMVTASWQGEESDGVDPVFGMLRGGEASLKGLRPGRWKVELQEMQGGADKPNEVVDVVAGEATEVRFSK